MTDKNKCPNEGCDKKSQESHTCPFLVEINEDSETLCSCCEDCEDVCADDI